MSEAMNKAKEPQMAAVTPTPSTLNHAAPEFRPPPPKSSVPVPMIPDPFAPLSQPPATMYPVLLRPPMIIHPVLRPPFKLNPDALAYGLETVHQDKRSLYITLSNGFPLTERQIFNFFNRWYPSSVEDVHVHKRAGGKPGLFGKVTFKRANTPSCVMGNYQKVCVNVDGFPLYCKWFVSKATGESSNAANTASNIPRDE